MKMFPHTNIALAHMGVKWLFFPMNLNTLNLPELEATIEYHKYLEGVQLTS